MRYVIEVGTVIPAQPTTNEDNMSKQTYIIAAKHEAFGVEGSREYVGTERGAKMAATKIAKAAGYGWVPMVREA